MIRIIAEEPRHTGLAALPHRNIQEPVRYQNHLEKQALSILHPINRM